MFTYMYIDYVERAISKLSIIISMCEASHFLVMYYDREETAAGLRTAHLLWPGPGNRASN